MIQTISAAGISSLLEVAPAGIKILSLDCFDTLLWRNVATPRDVFAELEAAGGAGIPRARAEYVARQMREQRDGLSEVSIEQICASLAPGTLEAELAAEARHCFAFAPVVTLMAAARLRGIKVMIVSDTYLSEIQLRALIAATAGEDVAAGIDLMFCSSEHGRDKAGGLFETVLETLAVPAATILHLGDNKVADFDAPNRLGINAVHFEQFSDTTQQQLRFEAALARMIEPATGVTVPTMQPHRAALSIRGSAHDTALIGHDVFGPVMLGFARWIRAEADALAAATGRPVRPVFMMRDGHLPHRVFEAAGLGDAATVEISRFTARRASFRNEDAIRKYLSEEKTEQVAVLGRQLLLTEGEVAKFNRSHTMLRAAVLEPQWVTKITKRSAQFADRLAAHVRSQTQAEPGDTLMMIDLGYQGSVQDLSQQAIIERLGVDIVGRYLLLTEILSEGRDKQGLLDTRHYDFRALLALSSQIAPVEQICTIGNGSVIDYRDDGRSMRRSANISAEQSALREEIQTECLAYVAHAAGAKHRPAASDGVDTERRMVAAALSRFLLMPRSEEVALLHRFDHDVNLGTNELSLLIDPQAAATGLRRRGLNYLSEADRMYLAGEVQCHGLPYSLSLLTSACFGLDLRQADFQTGGIDVPVLLLSSTSDMAMTATAYPTHDGYYLLTIPNKAGDYATGVQIGQIAEVVQIDSVRVMAVGAPDVPIPAYPEIAVAPVFDDMDCIADGIHRCGENGLIFVPPVQTDTKGPLMLAIVFRPVTRRRTSATLKKAA